MRDCFRRDETSFTLVELLVAIIGVAFGGLKGDFNAEWLRPPIFAGGSGGSSE